MTGFISTITDITATRKTEDLLLHERELRQRYLELAGEIIVTLDSEGKITFVNRQGCRMLACEESEMIDMNWFDNFLPPSDRKEVRRVFARLMQGEVEQLAHFENEVLTTDGKMRAISWRNALLTDEAGNITETISAGTDIAKRKRAERESREHELQLENLLSNIDAIILEKSSSNLFFVGGQVEKILGYPKNSWFEHPLGPMGFWSSLIHPDDVAKSEACRHASARGDKCRCEYRLIAKNGEPIWFYDSAIMENGNGDQTKTRSVMVDITEHKNLEQDLLQHQDVLAHVTRLSTMGEMATGLAHEINQPLGAILLYVSEGLHALAGSKPADVNQLRELFDRLEGLATHVSDVVQRLRRLTNKKPTIFALIDVNQPIDDVLKLLHSELRLGEVVVKLKIEQADLVASMDEIQIQQVLMNLIRNAVDAMSETPPRQRILTISNSRNADDMIEIAVSDTGTGISNEAIGQIFDTFYTTKPDGMGLGLAISQTIIEAHNGKLWATPNSDRGVTFHFSLPVAKQQNYGQAQPVR